MRKIMILFAVLCMLMSAGFVAATRDTACDGPASWYGNDASECDFEGHCPSATCIHGPPAYSQNNCTVFYCDNKCDVAGGICRTSCVAGESEEPTGIGGCKDAQVCCVEDSTTCNAWCITVKNCPTGRCVAETTMQTKRLAGELCAYAGPYFADCDGEFSIWCICYEISPSTSTSTDTGEGAIPELSTMAGIVGIIVVLALILRKNRK